MACAPTFKYSPLSANEIRVIVLLPGSFDSQLKLAVIHISFDKITKKDHEPPVSLNDVQRTLPPGWTAYCTPEGIWFYDNGEDYEYEHPNGTHISEAQPEAFRFSRAFEALSYVWGDPQRTCEAHVNDDETTEQWDQLIGITHNLDRALRHLRRPSASRTLWVDALCIDQENDEEKGVQLPLMGDLYASAFRVIAWTGEATPDAPLALSTLEYLGQQVEISDTYRKFRSKTATERNWHDITCTLPYTGDQWDAIGALFSRPWFERLWIVQEILRGAARAVIVCGDNAISFYNARRAIAAFVNMHCVPSELRRQVNAIAQLAYGYSRHANSQSLITMAREYRCTVAHDRVYALLGLFPDALRDNIRPSYQIPFSNLYRDVLLQHASITGRLDWMTYCAAKVDDQGGPSWAPDWRRSKGLWFDIHAANRASGSSPAYFELLPDNTLRVSGMMHGSIAASLPHLDGNNNAAKLSDTIPLEAMPTTYRTEEPMVDALAKVLLITYRERTPAEWWRPSFKGLATTLREVLSTATPAPADDECLKTVAGEGEYYNWRGGYVVWLDTGYFAFVPLAARLGDRICVLPGVYAPLVLRPRSDGKYSVVGACRVQGLMDGEGLLGPLPEGWLVRYAAEQSGHLTMRFYDERSKAEQKDDPRFPALPEDWNRIDVEPTSSDVVPPDCFQNRKTGEVIKHDPRTSRQALSERGVDLQDIDLV